MSKSEPCEGKIGRTYQDSDPWWPVPKRSTDDSPNVVVILLDDTGFAHFGCYGSTIETPNIDALAERYVKYGKTLHLRHLSPDCRQLLRKAGDLVVVSGHTSLAHDDAVEVR